LIPFYKRAVSSSKDGIKASAFAISINPRRDQQTIHTKSDGT